ncbi:MAG: PAS domain S-box protein [Betaproteobacteria bacterium]|nr:PAS domain S-box protein [Betaproteobacteria bacterium]
MRDKDEGRSQGNRTEESGLKEWFGSLRQQDQDNFKSAIDRHIIVSVADGAGRIVEVNPMFSRISGYLREELIGQDHRLLNSGLHPKSFFEDMWHTIGVGKEWQGRIRNRRKDGDFYWVATTIVPFLGNDGQPYQYVSIHIDITDQVAAEVQAQQTLLQIIEGSLVPTFVIDAEHVVTHWNKACAQITGIAAAAMVGMREYWRAFYPEQRLVLADLVVNGASEAEIADSYGDTLRRSPLLEGAFEAEGFFAGLGETGRWLYFTVAPLRNGQGQISGAIETLQDITERKLAEQALHRVHGDLEQLVLQRTAQLAQANLKLAEDIRQREQAEVELHRRNAELADLNARLGEALGQLLQKEKMASIGQLAAGVAHEINNPIGFVQSNMGTLENYLEDLFRIIDAYAATEGALPADAPTSYALQRLKAELDLDFLREDIPKLMAESRDGITRVSKIVQDLKDFSRVDTNQEWKWADLHRGLDSTVNVANNEIKYKADVVKKYGTLPEIECLPSELNQVFLNLLVNAAHALADDERGTITLRTGCDDRRVWVEVADTGSGIAPENLKRIFDPFFTTKPIGKGTGLGLSLSYGIVKKHGGSIEVDSEVGKGSTFRVILPISQTHEPDTVLLGG